MTDCGRLNGSQRKSASSGINAARVGVVNMIPAFSNAVGLGSTSATHLLFQPSFTNDRPLFGLIELFKFDDFYEVSLGVAVVFLFMAIGWSLLLRRKVREQREALREQFDRET